MSKDKEGEKILSPKARPDSQELLRRARAGDENALDQLFSRLLPQMHRWAHRRVPGWARSSADTADLVQETVLQTIRNLDTFEAHHVGGLRHYLRRSLMNRVRDQFRRAGRHPALVELDEGQFESGESPLELAMARQNRERYTAALERLKASDRTAVIGRIELGYSYEQLAVILGKPTSEAARLAVRRALLRMANFMRDA